MAVKYGLLLPIEPGSRPKYYAAPPKRKADGRVVEQTSELQEHATKFDTAREAAAFNEKELAGRYKVVELKESK